MSGGCLHVQKTARCGHRAGNPTGHEAGSQLPRGMREISNLTNYFKRQVMRAFSRS